MQTEKRTITPRSEDFSQWYLDVIDAAELAEHAPVKGCMVIRPTGYAIWEQVQKQLDTAFKEVDVENAYFPLLIPQSMLTREAHHVEGFSPELAVVTHAGGKELEEPLVIRPTSETVIQEMFKRWIQSYNDLPLIVNQWANVVRWEMRTRLFLRTTEFLWQEGHTCHETQEEADARARQMLEIYKHFAEHYMAIPVHDGEKSESEKFAGADRTYTIEAMMQDGKSLQFATSHNLGQNFAKAFDVEYLDRNNTLQNVWQTSWGLSTRSIGGLIMVHSDDAGLVLPPRIAPVQVVILVVPPKEPADMATLTDQANSLAAELKSAGIRVKVDASNERFGQKIFYWEKRGVPVRIEMGQRELAEGNLTVARRDTSEKQPVALKDVVGMLPEHLETIQEALFAKALSFRAENTVIASTWEEFTAGIEAGKFVQAHWDGTVETEAKIKAETTATIRCRPFALAQESGVCVVTGKPSSGQVLFAKSY